MSERVTDERLAELKDAHYRKSPFHVGYANTIDILAMITELQERRASSPAAGRDAVIEECAKVADDAMNAATVMMAETTEGPARDYLRSRGAKFATKTVADRIRALKETPNGN